MRNCSPAEVSPLPLDWEPIGKHWYLQMCFHSELSEVRFMRKCITGIWASHQYWLLLRIIHCLFWMASPLILLILHFSHSSFLQGSNCEGNALRFHKDLLTLCFTSHQETIAYMAGCKAAQSTSTGQQKQCGVTLFLTMDPTSEDSQHHVSVRSIPWSWTPRKQPALQGTWQQDELSP